jgi:hypothetical protein
VPAVLRDFCEPEDALPRARSCAASTGHLIAREPNELTRDWSSAQGTPAKRTIKSDTGSLARSLTRLAMARFSILVALSSLSIVLAHSPLLPFPPFIPEGLAPVSCPPRASHDHDADFLILGAGMSGLGAAHYLHTHTQGCTIRILEARDVPGGRVRTLETGPFAGMEVGAGWIHEYKGNPVLAVAEASGVSTKVRDVVG